MKYLKNQIFASFITIIIKSAAHQYLLSPQVIVVDKNNYFKDIPYVNRNYLQEHVGNKKLNALFTYNQTEFKLIVLETLIEEPFTTNQSYFPKEFIKEVCIILNKNQLLPHTLNQFINRIKLVSIEADNDQEFYGYALAPSVILIDNNNFIKKPAKVIDQEDSSEIEFGLDSNNIYKEESFDYDGHQLKIILLNNPINNLPLTNHCNFPKKLNQLIDKKVENYNTDLLDLTKISFKKKSQKLLNGFLLHLLGNKYATYAYAFSHQVIILDETKYFGHNLDENKVIDEKILKNIYYQTLFFYNDSCFQLIFLRDAMPDLLLTDRSQFPEEFIVMINQIIKDRTKL